MEHLDTTHEKILVIILVIFTWMSLVFFLDWYHFYNQQVYAYQLIEIDGNVTTALLKYEPKCGAYRCFDGDEFKNLFDTLQEDTLSFITEPDVIIDGKEVDMYLRTFAENLGYQPRNFFDESLLTEYNTLRTPSEVKLAYTRLKDDMLEDGIALHLVSAYRSFTDQKKLFLQKFTITDEPGILEGKYDTELATALERTALPGYSKHHTGYAVDFGCGSDYLVYEFAETECYAWMSQNNFEPVKQYGFIPSYPNDALYQGPQPEPWEYVWVGSEVLE